MPAPVLVLYAHPWPHRSVVNRRMAAAARSLPNVELVDLYEASPDFHFDLRVEQKRVEAARLLVFQHPFFWYGMPGLLKQWVDSVLQSGWAYGKSGFALHGKDFMLAVTTGGREQDYGPGREHGFAFEAFLPPFEQLARFCGMRWRPPLVLHDAHGLPEEAVTRHVETYRDLLAAYPKRRDSTPAARP